MKITKEAVATFFLNGAALFITSQAVSFSRYSRFNSIETMINRHATLLLAAGVGLLATFGLIQSLTARIAKLEAVVASRSEPPTAP